MRTDIVYELVDVRRPESPHYPLPPLAVLQGVSGGLDVLFPNGHGFHVELPDDDASVRFEEHNGGDITIHRDDGDVVLVPLTAERYGMVCRFLGERAPRSFDSEAAMHRYWRSWITEREVGG